MKEPEFSNPKKYSGINTQWINWKQEIMEVENSKAYNTYMTMNSKQRFTQALKDLGLNYFQIAKITGHSYSTIKNALQPKADLPKWCKLVLYAYEKTNH